MGSVPSRNEPRPRRMLIVRLDARRVNLLTNMNATVTPGEIADMRENNVDPRQFLMDVFLRMAMVEARSNMTGMPGHPLWLPSQDRWADEKANTRSITDAQVSRLPSLEISEIHALIESGENCPVCMTEYDEDDVVVRLPCRHVFHGPCVRSWLTSHGTCPNCRFQLAPALDEHKKT